MNDKSLLIALFALLEREGAVSIPQIAALLGSDEETVWRLLEELVFAYDSVSVRLELGESYARLERAGTSRMLRLNAAETDVLLDALRAHGFTADDELVRKLAQAKGFLGEGSARVSSTTHAVPGPLMLTLAQACEDEEHRLLEIEYHKDGGIAAEPRTVEPYVLSAEGDHSYLEAYDSRRGGWRSFRVDRIKAAHVLEERFEPRKRGDDGAPDEAATATVRFAPGAFPADWKRIRKAATLEDGSVEARLPWFGSMWLPKKIVAMQGAATPVSPPELREACADYAQRLLDGMQAG